MKIAPFLERLEKPIWFLIGSALLGIVGYLDYITGPELSFSLFYAIPIVFFSWKLRGNYSIVAALISGLIWFFIEIQVSQASIFIHLWNGSIRLGYFLMVALFLKSLERERQYSRTDFLTGAFNHRYFQELLQREVDRSHRYNLTFSLAFIDMDNFKVVNDTFGHTFGDSILRVAVETMQNSLRKTDIIARAGGDEFVILLPETDEQAARSAITHMVKVLKEEMLKCRCPVTFSIGVITMTAPDQPPGKILSSADQIMYMVKHNGKDNVRYDTYKNVNAETNSTPPTRPLS